jgi:hypothetical protein
MFAVGSAARSGLLIGYGSIAGDRIGEGMARLHEAFEAP